MYLQPCVGSSLTNLHTVYFLFLCVCGTRLDQTLEYSSVALIQYILSWYSSTNLWDHINVVVHIQPVREQVETSKSIKLFVLQTHIWYIIVSETKNNGGILLIQMLTFWSKRIWNLKEGKTDYHSDMHLFFFFFPFGFLHFLLAHVQTDFQSSSRAVKFSCHFLSSFPQFYQIMNWTWKLIIERRRKKKKKDEKK